MTEAVALSNAGILDDPVLSAACPRVPTRHGDMKSMFAEAARDAAGRPALIYFDTTLTYADVDQRSDHLAQWLLQSGVGRGDRVSIILQNMPHAVLMMVAAWKVGAIPVPGNPMYRSAEMARIFRDCEPAVVMCASEIVAEMRTALEAAGLDSPILAVSPRDGQKRNDERVIPAEPATPQGALTFDQVMATATDTPLPDLALDPDDIGLILYTSGTTGEPKGAMLRHRSLAFNAEGMGTLGSLSPESRILGIAPLFHITGVNCHVTSAIAAKCALILHYRVHPGLVLDVIREHRPTFTIGAITAFSALMNLPDIVPADMASFERVYSGGAPIAPAIQAEFERKLGVYILPAYGMTETIAQAHWSPFGERVPVDPESGALSIGKAVPHLEARILGDDGTMLGPNQVGELLMRGPQIMAGYWRKAEQSREALANGWMHSGDVAFYDEDGWFYLVDRLKDCIIASGFKVWPREVEDTLYTHEAVREAAVVGVADAYRGETVKAFVSLKPGAEVSPDTLAAFCRDRLAAYKVPRQVEILDDLPKTVTGKIQRLVLREREAAAAKG
jgi:long-chain acyl-CoA synthetase